MMKRRFLVLMRSAGAQQKVNSVHKWITGDHKNIYQDHKKIHHDL